MGHSLSFYFSHVELLKWTQPSKCLDVSIYLEQGHSFKQSPDWEMNLARYQGESLCIFWSSALEEVLCMQGFRFVPHKMGLTDFQTSGLSWRCVHPQESTLASLPGFFQFAFRWFCCFIVLLFYSSLLLEIYSCRTGCQNKPWLIKFMYDKNKKNHKLPCFAVVELLCNAVVLLQFSVDTFF